MNDQYQISTDPIWHRWIDGIVILVIGITAGIVLAGSLLFQEVTTTTTTEVIRQLPTSPQIESGINTDTPSGIRIEES